MYVLVVTNDGAPVVYGPFADAATAADYAGYIVLKEGDECLAVPLNPTD